MQDHEDPNGYKIVPKMSQWPDENFKGSGWWPLDGNHEQLEQIGISVSRWNLMYPLLPWDV